MLLVQGFGVHTGLVFFVLIVRDLVRGHVFGVGVALSAGFGDVGGKHCRLRVVGLADPVDGVAADTCRHILITAFEALTVDAGVVLLHLIHPQTRIKLSHERRVAVALAAERRDLRGRGLAYISFSGVFGGFLVVLRWIATVAVDARESLGSVDVVFEQACGFGQLAIERAVAFDAGVLRLGLQGRLCQTADRPDERRNDRSGCENSHQQKWGEASRTKTLTSARTAWALDDMFN